MSIDDIENFVQRGPLPEVYNAIYATIIPSFKVHSSGYVVNLHTKVQQKYGQSCLIGSI